MKGGFEIGDKNMDRQVLKAIKEGRLLDFLDKMKKD
jgi:hypothetical protein